MEKVFVMPAKLAPVMWAIYKTLLHDCEKNIRIAVKVQGLNSVWFRVFVPPKQKKDGSLRVSGCIDACHFKVYASPVSASFDVEDKRFDTEQAFYTFINIIALYRNQRRLSPLNTGLLNGLAGGRKQTIEDKTRTLINGGAI